MVTGEVKICIMICAVIASHFCLFKVKYDVYPIIIPKVFNINTAKFNFWYVSKCITLLLRFMTV